MAGRAHRQKGNRKERALVELHRAADIPCQRVPLSGAAGGEWRGDLIVGPKNGTRYRGEAKARAHGAGFKVLERWLGQHDLLFLWRDRQKPMVCMPWALYQSLMRRMYVGPEVSAPPVGADLGAGPGGG